MNLVDAHTAALDHTHRLVGGIGPTAWGDPTPDDDWDVRTLVNHVVAGNFWVAPLVEGRTIAEVGDRLDGDVLGDDPQVSYEASADEAAAAFGEPGALDRPVAVSYGPVPASVYCSHRFLDVLIHGWDLAVATDQDRALPGDLVAMLWEIVEPQAEDLAASGAFGGHVDVPAGADLQTRLLAALGRRA